MHVLVGADGSRDAQGALEWLLELPLPGDCKVSIVTALPWPALHDEIIRGAAELRAHAQGVMRAARDRLVTRWPEVTGRVVEADPREALIEAATLERADLVVVGARVLGAMASLLLGRVSTSLTREAPCSVLVCKGEPRPIRSVTVALDGSEHARAALRFFTTLPLPSGLRVHLVAAVEPLRYPSTAPAVIGPHLIGALKQYEQEQLAVLEPMLAEAALEIRRAGPAVTTAAIVGPAADVIVSEASKHASDLVVMGARGLGALKRLLLGSVSESVLRHAGCPVLIVRPRSDDAR